MYLSLIHKIFVIKYYEIRAILISTSIYQLYRKYYIISMIILKNFESRSFIEIDKRY